MRLSFSKMIEDIRIILSATWVATVLNFLLIEVMHILSGDAEKVLSSSPELPPYVWFLSALYKALPIIMVVLSLTVSNPLFRTLNIYIAGFWLIINLIGIPMYRTPYDTLLRLVSIGFMISIIQHARGWI